jgi:hypothetical protein
LRNGTTTALKRSTTNNSRSGVLFSTNPRFMERGLAVSTGSWRGQGEGCRPKAHFTNLHSQQTCP